MKSALNRKTSFGIIQIAPLIIVAILVLGGLVAFSPKSSDSLGTKLAVLKSESESDSSDNSGPGSTESSSDDNQDGDDDEDVDEIENEVEDEDENEIEDEEELEVESGTEAAKIKVKIKVKRVDNRFVITEREIEAETNFPLSVNPETRELTVTTPAGEKVVTILPDQAVSNMLANNVFDRQENVNIVFEDETVIYRISGARDERLFGLFRITLPSTAIVSADTGQLIAQEQAFLFRFLDLLSIE